MGNCCARRERQLQQNEHAAIDEYGGPSPSAPHVDSQGNRLSLSPTSGALRITYRTPLELLQKLD